MSTFARLRLIIHSMKTAALFSLVLATCAAAPASEPADVFRPGQVWLDNNITPINAHGGGLLFFNNTWYWFGEHKVAGSDGNKAMVGVHCYSSADLYRWKDEKIALAVSDDPQSDIAQGCILERPKVLYNESTKKFVMWFHLERKGKGYKDARAGIATADAPTGPYTFLHSLRPNAKVWPENAPDNLKALLSPEELASLANLKLPGGPVAGQIFPADLLFRRDFAAGQMARDMTLFVDDDTQHTAYQIYSSEDNGTLHISQLSDDYTKPAGRYWRILPGGFNEAPTLLKHNRKYFLITSGTSGWSPNAARLAIADKVFGPYTALENPCRGEPDDVKTTFHSQGTFIQQLPGRSDAYAFLADRWTPKNPIDGRYVWLPVQFDEQGNPLLQWHDTWTIDSFYPQAK